MAAHCSLFAAAVDWIVQLNVLLLLLARRTAEIASAFVRFESALRFDFDNDRSRKPVRIAGAIFDSGESRRD